ncbi:MAG TPA: CoA pyrophosphatase [Nevskiaceae bacterium]|nr:CoA pyrophosphatase [Nevskiaceae bacterium]
MSPATDPALLRLRRALDGTAENPRRLADFDLPLGAQRWLPERLLEGLKPAAVLLPVLLDEQGARVLLTRRSEQLRAHKGQISFPGGRRDPGDRSLTETALRETEEEVGLPRAQVEVLGYLDDIPTLTGYRVTPVVGLVQGPWQAQPDAREVAEVFALPMQRVFEPASFERKWFTREGINVPFYEIHQGPHRIWGATAAMLWHLHRRLLAT